MYAIRRYVNLKQFAKFERLAGIGQNHTNRTFYTYSPEPGQPINRDPTFCSIEDAVKCVKSGNEKTLEISDSMCMNRLCFDANKMYSMKNSRNTKK